VRRAGASDVSAAFFGAILILTDKIPNPPPSSNFPPPNTRRSCAAQSLRPPSAPRSSGTISFFTAPSPASFSQSCSSRTRSARFLGIIRARHNIRAKPIEAGHHRKRRSVKDHSLPARLGVGQKQQPAFQVHLFPFEVQDFPQPTASEQQQPDRCRGEGINLTWTGQSQGVRQSELNPTQMGWQALL
jgi:hypothetical protein